MSNDKIYCPSCGTASSIETKFCPKCGDPLPKPIPPVTTAAVAEFTLPGESTDLITLNCPHCGGCLPIANNIERLKCHYCGYDFLVMREEGVVILEPALTIDQKREPVMDQPNQNNTPLMNSNMEESAEQRIALLKKEISELKAEMAVYRNKDSKIMLIGLVFVLIGGVGFVISALANRGILLLLINIVIIIIGLVFLTSKGSKLKEEEIRKTIEKKQADLEHNYSSLRHR